MQKPKWDGIKTKLSKYLLISKKVFITTFWLLVIFFAISGAVFWGEFLGSHDYVGFQEKLVSPIVANK